MLKPETRVAAFLLLAILLHPSTAPAAGSLTPPGAPAPTMKTLQEIEPRNLIASVPFTITTPGSYYLSNNLAVASGNAITIAASGVTLDLNGFTLSSTANPAAGSGVMINNLVTNVAILRGSIQGGVSDNGSGVFSGTGFAYGIDGFSGYDIRVADVAVSGCSLDGIVLGTPGVAPYATVVERCVVKTMGNLGISANVVSGSTAMDCGGDGIDATVASDCMGASAAGGMGVYAQNINNCYGTSASYCGLYAAACANNSYGYTSTGPYGLSATVANNCFGYALSGNYGLDAFTANNCYGVAGATNAIGLYAYDAAGCFGSGGAAGVLAPSTAIGCTGSGNYGNGVYAYDAENCNGYCGAPSGSATCAGINAYCAHNCYGSSYYQAGILLNAGNNCYGTSTYGSGIAGNNTLTGANNTGSVAENSCGSSTYSDGITVSCANNCYGASQSGSGLYASTANNCYGYTYSGYAALRAGTANNCYGYFGADGCASFYSYGIYADLANNCYGVNASTNLSGVGIGLHAQYAANNCYGVCYNQGTGLESFNVATGCYGECDGGNSTGVYCGGVATSCVGVGAYTGVNTYVANGCLGDNPNYTEEFTWVVASYKYNMP